MSLWEDPALERAVNEVGKPAHRHALYFFASLLLGAIAALTLVVLAVPGLRPLLLAAPVAALVGRITVPAELATGVLAVLALVLYRLSRRTPGGHR